MKPGSKPRISGRSLRSLVLILATWLLPPGLVLAQGLGSENPPSPASIAVGEPVFSGQSGVTSLSEPLPKHRFWDRDNVMLFSGVAVFRCLDYASTRNMQARGREEILLPDDVVNNSAGFATLQAAGTATSIGLSYWMHRTGHHKLERWISIVHMNVTGFGVARNYALDSRHP